ncbi:hypothetical protein H8S75_21685 [Hungatella sp. L12]|uniref:Peptide O-xylosyltransferase n=1 Tax=Hungatella hominis TaxID=2763050 RepID=A0ABR7HBM7_9FIRM|nr:beta-1,6-N-acetylglucosaminyltransferase [Hungatella hominis]MBC5710563.1 hypothetical protein [Hungatella hominis]
MGNGNKFQKHAYLVIAYDNFKQLEKLIKTLDDERNEIFVHVDKKTKVFTETVKKKLIGGVTKGRIEIYNEIAVYWSHYSIVDCELFLLEKAAKKHKFEYYHLLSGQCYPIKSQEYIHDFFKEHKGKEFVDYQQKFFENHSDVILKRIKYYHPFRKYCRFFKYKWMNDFFRGLNLAFVTFQEFVCVDHCKKNDLDICYGSQWFSITDKFAQYILERRNYIKADFKYSNAPDELFMQTILKSSPFLKNLYRETSNTFYGNMRLIDFHRGNPYTYRSTDIEEIKRSDYLFVRKVDERIEPGILELIAKECNLEWSES